MPFNFTPCGCCGGGSGCTTGVLCFRIRNSITSVTTAVYDDIAVDIERASSPFLYFDTTTTNTDGSYDCISVPASVNYRLRPKDVCGSSTVDTCNNYNIQTTFSLGSAGACVTTNNTFDYCCTCYSLDIVGYPYSSGTLNGLTWKVFGASDCQYSETNYFNGICLGSGTYTECTPYNTLLSTSGIRLRNLNRGVLLPYCVCVPNGSGGGSYYCSNCNDVTINYCDGITNSFTASFNSKQTADRWITNIGCDSINFGCTTCTGYYTSENTRFTYFEPPLTLDLDIPLSMGGWFGLASGTTVTLNFDTQVYNDSINNWSTWTASNCAFTDSTIGCDNYYGMWDWSTCIPFSATVKMNIHFQLTRGWAGIGYSCFQPLILRRNFFVTYWRGDTCGISGYASTNDLSWIIPTGQYCTPFYLDFGGGLVLSE